MKLFFVIVIAFAFMVRGHDVLLGKIDKDGLIRPSNGTCLQVGNEHACERFSGCRWFHDLDPSCRNTGFLPPSGRCGTQKKNVTCINWDACEWVECLHIRRCIRKPTPEPTTSPTFSPTGTPTTSPTQNPTTISPTSHPTNPTKMPTISPTNPPVPTRQPSSRPTQPPTSPTRAPTKSPTKLPTKEPTEVPTTSPTFISNNNANPTSNGSMQITVSVLGIMTIALFSIQNNMIDE